jgi:hypothetical protein
MGTLHSQRSLARSAVSGGHATSRRPIATGLRFNLPLDEEDYLMPSAQSLKTTPTNNNNPYMDLISSDQAKGSNTNTMFPYPPPQNYFLAGKESVKEKCKDGLRNYAFVSS